MTDKTTVEEESKRMVFPDSSAEEKWRHCDDCQRRFLVLGDSGYSADLEEKLSLWVPIDRTGNAILCNICWWNREWKEGSCC